jgi:hypothetical protein
LRLAICQCLIHALIGTKDLLNIQKATDLVAYVEAELGDRPLVLMLRLELLDLAPEEEFDASAYSDILRRMIHSSSLAPLSFKLLLHRARRLFDRDVILSCAVLDELLSTKLITSDQVEWIERAIVLRIWMITSKPCTSEWIDRAMRLFSNIQTHIAEPLKGQPTLAAQSVRHHMRIRLANTYDTQLIWKQIESAYSNSQFDLCEQWCFLASHQLFRGCGLKNHAKISR